MKIPLKLTLLGSLILCLAACATNSIKRSWRSPAYQGPARKVAVLAVEDRGSVREGVENRFVNQMTARGQAAFATCELMSLSTIKDDKEAAAARLRAAGADAILIVRLVDQPTYDHEVQTTPALHLPVMTGDPSVGWYDYYSTVVMTRGVSAAGIKQAVYLDTGVFDLGTGQRVWSALTQTVVKEEGDRLPVVDNLVAKIVNALRKDGITRR